MRRTDPAHYYEPREYFEQVPEELVEEQFELLAKGGDVRLERIVSKGHSSPGSGWYDQNQNEWVIVLRGEATVLFEDDCSSLHVPANT